MNLVVMDQEIIRAGIMISSTMEEIIRLNKDFTGAIDAIITRGYEDVLISSALVEKAQVLSNTVTQIAELIEDTRALPKSYIDEIDEKDKYLY